MSGWEIWPCTEGPGRRDVELDGKTESGRMAWSSEKSRGVSRRGGLTGARCDGRSRQGEQKDTECSGLAVIDGGSLWSLRLRVQRRVFARVAG